MSLQGTHTRQVMAAQKFIDHRIASATTEPIEALLYEYLLAGNGLFVRAARREFSVSLPVCSREIRGLPEARVGIFWHRQRIRPLVWREILLHAQRNSLSTEFREDVYLIYWDNAVEGWQWRPAGRDRSLAATIADDSLVEYENACIELHTHPPGALNFSRADDRDESGKFRIFAILVDVHDKPKIRFRCGVYDHLVEIPSSWVGALPDAIVDLNEIEALVKMML